MNFQPSPEQRALQEGIRSYCETRLTVEELRRLEGRGVDRALWKELAEMGVFALRLPEERGGLGLGAADAVLVFEELGRKVVPGPLVWTQLAAELVDSAASGEVVVGGLDLCSASASPYLIEHYDSLDALLVLRPGGVEILNPQQLEVQPVKDPLDPLTPLHHAPQLPAGKRIRSAADAKKLRLEGMALASALCLGIAEATLDMANAYAKQREQFNRPIGSFQAIKHMLADMFVQQEVARAAAYAAGATIDHPEAGDVEQAARGAKLVCAEAAINNARACIQIHGGMGYTWEVPAHYYLKRAWVLDTVFGSSDEHAERIAGILAAPDAG
jgi:alkylation response protein AidB-like acyl-CoA dehydrogenase